MQAQDVFNKVWDHFITREQPLSYVVEDGRRMCRYRGPNGARCAAGLFLEDEGLAHKSEGTSAGYMVNQYPNAFGEASQFAGLLDNLQSDHDCTVEHAFIHNPTAEDLRTHLSEAFAATAARYGLAIPA